MKITVHLEHLYHYTCAACEKWWTVADIQPIVDSTIHCPHCGFENIVGEIVGHQLQPKQESNSNEKD